MTHTLETAEPMSTEHALGELGQALDDLHEVLAPNATVDELAVCYDAATARYAPDVTLSQLIDMVAIVAGWQPGCVAEWSAFMRCLATALAFAQHDALTDSFAMGARCVYQNQIINK